MEKQTLFSFTFIFILVIQLHAQNAPGIEWVKSLGGSGGDAAASIVQTTDGGFIVAGSSNSNDDDVSGNHLDSSGNTTSDYWIAKLDSSGSLSWQKSFGGSGNDGAASIVQTTDGGFIVAGSSNSNDGDVSGNHPDSSGNSTNDYWIAKLDSSGSLSWQKSFGGSGDDIANSIQQTTDGGFIVAGSTLSNDGDISGWHHDGDPWCGPLLYDFCIIKIDSLGDIQWQKSLGGSGRDEAYSIQQTADGGFVVAGYTESGDGDVLGYSGYYWCNQDIWIVKLDSSGNIGWQNCLGHLTEQEIAYAIEQTLGGGFIVAGTSTGGFDFYYSVYKLDSSGNESWAHYSNSGDHAIANSIVQTIDKGFIVSGWADNNAGNKGNTDCSVLKLDSTGNFTWQKSLGGTDYDGGYSVIQSYDGGFITAGNSSSIDGDGSGNHGSNDCLIVKLLPCGASETFYADADGDGYGNAAVSVIGIACSPPAGYVSDGSDCNDSSAAIRPFSLWEYCNDLDDNCNGQIDENLPLLTFYEDADGDTYGNPGNSILDCSAPVGYVIDNTDCDDTNPNVNPGMIEVSNNGIDDDCDGTVDEFGIGTSSIDKSQFQFSIFPNPTQDVATIQFTLTSASHVRMIVSDISGKEILTLLNDQLQSGEHSIQLNTAEFSKGVYLVKMISDFGIENRKLLIQ